jgi:hypothetical protein
MLVQQNTGIEIPGKSTPQKLFFRRQIPILEK